eukprot:TRINITY_DN30634_c0_g1_i1.p1 TRINITY_DN30634_c0_g1~~TRINITY_DN30634_c0_g1_i1.p1  ORF type:complete len:314 (-),score=22.20 TRINITY_DN30634_c0_g1_i1:201-1142(-)
MKFCVHFQYTVFVVCVRLLFLDSVRHDKEERRHGLHHAQLSPVEFIRHVKLEPHGVLGESLEDGKIVQIESRPGRDIAIVDPTGVPFVQAMFSVELRERLRPEHAGAASEAIYRYIGLWGQPRYDKEVKRAIQHFGDAKAHDYIRVVVIHVAGPDLRAASGHFKTREEAVQILSVAYNNVFSEFLKQPIETLWMPPVSGGLYSTGAVFQSEMPAIAWEAIARAFNLLPPTQQKALMRRTVDLCIFRSNQYKEFQDAKVNFMIGVAVPDVKAKANETGSSQATNAVKSGAALGHVRVYFNMFCAISVQVFLLVG